MCGRYALFTEAAELASQFDLDAGSAGSTANTGSAGSTANAGSSDSTDAASFEPTYNAAPTESLPIIVDEEGRTFDRARWGLVPSWADGPTGSDPINARAETLTETPSFRAAYRERRCLVPVDGFYEWVETSDGSRPHYVSRRDGASFALAGLWADWTAEQTQAGLDDFGAGGAGAAAAQERSPESLRSFTIVTTEPNDFLADYHHRMPVILPPGEERRWLDADRPGDLLEPRAADLQVWPVSTTVNDPTTDHAGLIDPLDGGS